MSSVKTVWATPEIDKVLGYITRVSNPANQANDKVDGLLRYCMTHGHVSPFEMANVCLELNTTRDIGRQVLRHRISDTKNRQNSLETDDVALKDWWHKTQSDLQTICYEFYEDALEKGIAKEQARAILPEGLTNSRMYMNGTLRSWIFYLKQRLDPTTQKEHRVLAQQVLEELRKVAPITMSAFFPESEDNKSGH